MPKAYGGRFVYLYVCNLDFLKVAKNNALKNTAQAKAQCNNIANLIALDFWIKALFSSLAWFAHFKHYFGTFQTSQTTNLLAMDLFLHLDTRINTTATVADIESTQ